MTKFAVLVFDGYRYEFRTTIEAKSVTEARKSWLKKCAPSQRKFKVSKETSEDQAEQAGKGAYSGFRMVD